MKFIIITMTLFLFACSSHQSAQNLAAQQPLSDFSFDTLLLTKLIDLKINPSCSTLLSEIEVEKSKSDYSIENVKTYKHTSGLAFGYIMVGKLDRYQERMNRIGESLLLVEDACYEDAKQSYVTVLAQSLNRVDSERLLDNL